MVKLPAVGVFFTLAACEGEAGSTGTTNQGVDDQLLGDDAPWKEGTCDDL